ARSPAAAPVAGGLVAPAVGGLVEHVDDAAPRRLPPTRRAAHNEGLARDHARYALALGHGVGVHHPGHDLLVGAEIGGGDVEVGADHEDDLRGVAAREVLALAGGHGPRGAPHAA